MNPIMGKYDKTKVLKKNINLSTPLMSRFDIFFVMTDECKESIDMAIAR
jgi:DNA replication licensing factor MCM6